MKAAVVDAGPLIHLTEIDGLALLRIFTALHIPDAVWLEAVRPGRVQEVDLTELRSVHRHTLPQTHVAQFLQHPDRASYTFVPMELGFQVQALAGEVHAENDGVFSVRFLVNVGKSKNEGERVYVGGESVVTLKNIRKFIASLHAALADLPRADDMRLS